MKKLRFDQESEDTVRKAFEELLTSMQGIPAEIKIPTHNATQVLKEGEKAIVYFENEAYKQMLALVDAAEKEIGWYGTVVRGDEPKTFVVKKILVFPQTVTQSTVKTDDTKFIEWQDSLSDEDFNTCRFYGHSHVTMAVSPSGVDDTFFNDTMQNVNDFYIFGIFNKSNAHWFNIYDVENNVLYENTDIKFMFFGTSEDDWADEQIKKYVTEEEYKPKSIGTSTSSITTAGKTKTEDPYSEKWWENRFNNKEKNSKGKKSGSHYNYGYGYDGYGYYDDDYYYD